MVIRFVGLLLLVGAGVTEAQKADSVYLRNGDRITGEVKSLRRALLSYSTDDLGTITIEWDKVDRISTRTVVEVRLPSGEKFYGSLELGLPGHVVLGGDTLRLADIVMMAPIEGQFVARLSGYVDLGFSFQKANGTTQLTSGSRLQYRGPKAEAALELTTFVEDRDDAEHTARVSTAFTQRVFLGNRWSTGFVVGYDRNDELDLAGRERLVGFGTRMLAESNHIEFLASGGLVLTRERYFSSDSSIAGFEGLLSAAFRAFRYDAPKLDASLTSTAFPSFTIGGRVRLQTDLRVSYELISDFMLTASLFDTFDSKPPSDVASKHDYGTTLAITWTY
jgi:Protein of unknown function, DUF481